MSKHNTTDFIEITGQNYKQVASVDSIGVYAPSSSAVARIHGYVDIEGNLYYENRHGVLVKRTAVNVNDERKSYRLCIDGEKFYFSIYLSDVRELFAARAKKQLDGAEFGYVVFGGNEKAEETCSGYDSHADAMMALQEVLEQWDSPSYHGIVFQVVGEMTMVTKYDYK